MHALALAPDRDGSQMTCRQANWNAARCYSAVSDRDRRATCPSVHTVVSTLGCWWRSVSTHHPDIISTSSRSHRERKKKRKSFQASVQMIYFMITPLKSEESVWSLSSGVSLSSSQLPLHLGASHLLLSSPPSVPPVLLLFLPFGGAAIGACSM